MIGAAHAPSSEATVQERLLPDRAGGDAGERWRAVIILAFGLAWNVVLVMLGARLSYEPCGRNLSEVLQQGRGNQKMLAALSAQFRSDGA